MTKMSLSDAFVTDEAEDYVAKLQSIDDETGVSRGPVLMWSMVDMSCSVFLRQSI